MPSYDEAQAIAGDTSAQRLLNLFFIFNASTRALSTEEIVSDSDLGYGSPQRDSDLRKFRRDRAKLAEQGIRIVEAKPLGAAESEESYWKLDRENTFATGGIVTRDDAQTLAAAIDEYLEGQATPLVRPLQSVRDKALELAEGSTPQTRDEQAANAFDPILDALWSAFATHKKIALSYRNARGEASKRSLAIYGIFSHEGCAYVTGLDDASQSIRTFRTDRIEKVWRPKGTYNIPNTFSIKDYVFLPFDFGEGESVQAQFSLLASMPQAAVLACTHGRGEIALTEAGSWRWTIEVRDIDAAASFALSHAREGLRPVAPQAFVDAWQRMIDKVVEAHGA